MNRYAVRTVKEIMARPPMTPPTIAPTGVGDGVGLGAGGGVGLLEELVVVRDVEVVGDVEVVEAPATGDTIKNVSPVEPQTGRKLS